MSLGTKIYTWFKGNLVGSDDLGNKYYCSSKDFKDLIDFRVSGKKRFSLRHFSKYTSN